MDEQRYTRAEWLALEKKELKEKWVDGVPCPCCGQLVKLYKRKLTSGMAVALINLYHRANHRTGSYHHITELGHLNGGEFAQLKRWGLIDEQPNDDETKRTSGMWCITQKGINFVENRLKVETYIFTYNMKTVGASDERSNIEEALGKRFNYREMMNNTEPLDS